MVSLLCQKHNRPGREIIGPGVCNAWCALHCCEQVPHSSGAFQVPLDCDIIGLACRSVACTSRAGMPALGRFPLL